MNDTKIIKFIEWLESEEDRFFAYAHKHLEKGEMTANAISSAEGSTYAKVRMALQDLLDAEVEPMQPIEREMEGESLPLLGPNIGTGAPSNLTLAEKVIELVDRVNELSGTEKEKHE